MRQQAELIRNEVKKIQHVTNVDIIGGRSRQVTVKIDKEKLAGVNLDMASIGQYMQAANFQMQAGNIYSGNVITSYSIHYTKLYEKVMKEFENAIRSRFAPFVDFPIVFASALTKQRILKVLEEARDVYENRKVKISTARLNEELLPLIEAYPPPSNKGKYIV